MDNAVIQDIPQDKQLKTETINPDYTRVTEVLYPFSGLSAINPDVLANAARRGTRVHEVCEGIVRGIGAWDLDEEIQGYVKSFEHWWDEGHNVVAVEKRFYCDELMITGAVDMIVQTPQGAVIVDIKTSSRPSKTWPLQGSAYAYMARAAGYDIQDIQFLHVNKFGKKPKIYSYPDQMDLYRSCLDVYNHFFKKKKKKVS